jgi:hypothetical protein
VYQDIQLKTTALFQDQNLLSPTIWMHSIHPRPIYNFNSKFLINPLNFSKLNTALSNAKKQSNEQVNPQSILKIKLQHTECMLYQSEISNMKIFQLLYVWVIKMRWIECEHTYMHICHDQYYAKTSMSNKCHWNLLSR